MTRSRPVTFGANNDPLEELDTFKPKVSSDILPMDELKTVSAKSGFTTREGNVENTSIDARSLRKTNRTVQLNISVSARTKDMFWEYALDNGHTVGEDALLSLLNAKRD